MRQSAAPLREIIVKKQKDVVFISQMTVVFALFFFVRSNVN